jgi:hypothetical protein
MELSKKKTNQTKYVFHFYLFLHSNRVQHIFTYFSYFYVELRSEARASTQCCMMLGQHVEKETGQSPAF